MRRISVFLCLILALIATPGMTSAQGWSGLGGFDAGLDLYVGYATNGGLTRGSADFSGTGFGGLTSLGFDFDPTHSLYLGAAVPVSSSLGMLRLAGSFTVPTTSRSVYSALGAVPSGREWSSDVMWTNLEAIYGFPVGGSTHVLAGFRWDRFDSRSRNPSDPSGLLVFITADSDKTSWTVNGYLPLVGMMFSTDGFTSGIVGFPVFLGDQVYKDSFNGFDLIHATGTGTFDKGYYLESFTEIALNNTNLIPQNIAADFKIFARFIYMGGSGRTNIIFNDTGTGIITDAVLNSSYYRRMIVLGGTANFSTAFLDGLTGFVGL